MLKFRQTYLPALFFLSAVFLLPSICRAALVINEINYNPAGTDDNHEWVELYNSGFDPIDLTGYKINDGDNDTSHALNVPPKNNGRGDMILPGGGYLLLADDAGTVISDLPGFAGTVIDTVLSLPNDSATVKILDKQGAAIAFASYTKDLGAYNNGKTLEWNGSSFQESAAEGGTPGAANDTSDQTGITYFYSSPASPYQYSKQIYISEFLPDPGEKQKQWVELYNAGPQKVNLSGWWLDDGASQHPQSLKDKEINPGQYLLIETEAPLLNPAGDKIKLVWPDGQPIHVIYFESSKTGFSCARFEGRWLWTNQLTPGQENKKSVFPDQIFIPVKSTEESAPAPVSVTAAQINPVQSFSPSPVPTQKPSPPLSAAASQTITPKIPTKWVLIALIFASLLTGSVFVYFRRQDKIDSQ